MTSGTRRALMISLATLMAARAPAAFAQSGAAAEAEALFQEARRLVDAGDYAHACPKFEASYAKGPGLGALMNLADCYERNGQLASAYRAFRSVESAAKTAGRKDREGPAKERAIALEPRLTKIAIHLREGVDVQVTRDEQPIDAKTLTEPTPVDPGMYAVTASAAHKRSWTQSYVVTAVPQSIEVVVPELADVAPIAPVAAPESPRSRPPASVPPPASDAAPTSSTKVVAVAVGGLGVAALAVGSVFGLAAKSTWNDAQSNHCHAGTVCDSTGVHLADVASTQGTFSTVFFVVGGVALASGVVLWLTAPKSSNPVHVTASAGPHAGGFLLRTDF